MAMVSQSSKGTPSRRGPCSIEGCTNAVLCKRLCTKHYYLTREYPACSDEACDRPGISRGMCTMHYKRWSRASGMKQPPSTRWNQARRDRYHSRRAQAGPTGDKVMVEALIERDGPQCSWCGKVIDLTLTWPNRMYRSIDHIVPVSQGGLHVMQNAQLLHFGCNASKGNRTT